MHSNARSGLASRCHDEVMCMADDELFPTIKVSPDAPPITPEMVAEALDETFDLPAAWASTEDGSTMPGWERTVTDGRDAH